MTLLGAHRPPPPEGPGMETRCASCSASRASLHTRVLAERREIFDNAGFTWPWLEIAGTATSSRARWAGAIWCSTATARAGPRLPEHLPAPGRAAGARARGNAICSSVSTGWAFNVNGRFASKYADGNYGEGHYSGGCADLTRAAPRALRDFLLHQFRPHAVSLSDYSRAKEIIDLVADQARRGEIVGAPELLHRRQLEAAGENSVDGFHGLPTHTTYFDTDQVGGLRPGQVPLPSNKLRPGHGHG